MKNPNLLFHLILTLALTGGGIACDETADNGVGANDSDTTSDNTETDSSQTDERIILNKSQLPHNQSPAPSSDTLQQLSLDNAAFALDLYSQLGAGSKDNLFFSPFSLSMALAMSYGGARNETEQQMADTLHFSLGQQKLHEAFNKISLELLGRKEPAGSEAENGFDLVLANGIWVDKPFPILPSYLDLLSENYNTGIYAADFQGEFDESVDAVNAWVADKTENKIIDVLNPETLSAPIYSILVNAIYFKAPWNLPFDPQNTTPQAFTLLSGETTTVEMMSQGEHFSYGEGEGYQAVLLPYDGEQLDMVLVVPDGETFTSFEESLDASKINTILDGMRSPYRTWVTLGIPKFSFSSKWELVDAFKIMGLEAPFADEADFSGMSEQFARIKKIFHQTHISVDEAGTEAAAATVVVDANGDADYVDLTLDRPFIFLIRDIPTNTILFMGRVVNPTL